jgi:dynein heavy chain
MHGSRYVKPFLSRVDAWEHTLTSLQDIIDNWLKVQAAWLYLEPIFSSDDITRQLPTESSMFTVVNGVWIESMSETAREPAVLSVARREGLLEQLTDANEKLDVIQKGLSDYLETKRLAFPRFFFLSNDELLEILAETKDPTKVRSRRPVVWRRLHAIDATRLHQRTRCVVFFPILSRFGPRRGRRGT